MLTKASRRYNDAVVTFEHNHDKAVQTTADSFVTYNAALDRLCCKAEIAEDLLHGEGIGMLLLNQDL